MKRPVVQILFLALFAQGCVAFTTKTVEKIPKRERDLRVTEAPQIELVFEGTNVEGTKASFQKIRSEFPFLEHATENNPEAVFTLSLQETPIGRKTWPKGEVGWGWCEAAYYVFALIPCYESETWRYQATWKNGSGEVLHGHEGQMRIRFLWHFYLFWAAPINLVTLPTSLSKEKKMWRRLIALIERDLARNEVTFRASFPSTGQERTDPGIHALMRINDP